jgi:hypothetical protein
MAACVFVVQKSLLIDSILDTRQVRRQYVCPDVAKTIKQAKSPVRRLCWKDYYLCVVIQFHFDEVVVIVAETSCRQ